MKIKGKLEKVLLPLFLVTIFVIVPSVSLGALWVQNVALLPSTAVVFSDDAAAMDRFMAAALKPYYGDRVGICDGVDDHVEIQAALDAVRDVKLSPGQFNCEVSIDIDNSGQTLRGCGRNTILATSTVDLVFLSAVGTDGSEKTGIVIKDLQIDGGASSISDCGIYFEYVDYSLIQNVYSRRHNSGTGTYLTGIYLSTSDFNTITGNTCQGNDNGIYLHTSNDNTVTSNTCQGNDYNGIYLHTSNDNTVTSNTCQGNDIGIEIYNANHNIVTGNILQGSGTTGILLANNSNDNTISANIVQGTGDWGINLSSSNRNIIMGNISRENQGDGIKLGSSNNNLVVANICQKNNEHGIQLNTSSHNTVTGNTLTENSQLTNNNYDDIYLTASDYNNIQGNTCRAGGLGAVPRYGINIADAACDGNLVTNNDIHNDAFGTGSLNDDGTATVTVAGNRV